MYYKPVFYHQPKSFGFLHHFFNCILLPLNQIIRVQSCVFQMCLSTYQKKSQRLLLTSCIVLLPSIVANFLQGICIQNAYQNSNLFAIFSWFIFSIIIAHFLVSQSVKIYKKGNGQTFIMIIRHHHRYLCFYEKISSAASTSIAPPPFSTAHFRRVCRLIFHEFINSKYNNQQPPHIYAMVSGGFLL